MEIFLQLFPPASSHGPLLERCLSPFTQSHGIYSSVLLFVQMKTGPSGISPPKDKTEWCRSTIFLFIYSFNLFWHSSWLTFPSQCQVKTHRLHQFSKLLKGIVKSSHQAQHNVLPSKSWECFKKEKKKECK